MYKKIFKELGYSFDGVHAPANDRDHYSLAYSQFIMPLVKSVQEQQKLIEFLNNKVYNQKLKIKNFMRRLDPSFRPLRNNETVNIF